MLNRYSFGDFMLMLAAFFAGIYIGILELHGQQPEPLPPITIADLHSVRTLQYGGGDWPISLDSDGRYYCWPPARMRDHDNRMWSGTWILSPDDTLTLWEAEHRCMPGCVPELVTAARVVTITLHKDGDRLTGHGWGQDLVLIRR